MAILDMIIPSRLVYLWHLLQNKSKKPLIYPMLTPSCGYKQLATQPENKTVIYKI